MKEQDQVTKVRIAMLMAADHIEKNPGDFDFYSVETPHPGTPGCALGWVNAFLGTEGKWLKDSTIPGMRDREFYMTMRTKYNCSLAIESPAKVATALRQFAQDWQP